MTISALSLLTMTILSRALYVAADLNIADLLASQPMTTQELAQATNSDTNSLEKMLRFLELHEVFKLQDDKKYHLTEFSQTMCHNHPCTIKPFLLHDDQTRWNCFGNLGHSIKTGKPSFDELYGMSYFEHLAQNPSLDSRFNQAMTIISSQEDAVIASALSFEGSVADIGGGTGQLLKNIMEYHPECNVILLDLPAAVEQAQLTGTACTAIAGSFFEPLTFKADTFILKRILHDWDDEKATAILHHVSNAMHDASKLYIIEGVLDYAKDQKTLCAIDLALLTIFGGSERNRAQYESLIKHVGLEIVAIHPINDLICAIECKKLQKPPQFLKI